MERKCADDAKYEDFHISRIYKIDKYAHSWCGLYGNMLIERN